tara:strand:- start:1796 stop:2011 length:216 start_codon:yes stop_codon:yes gene_type:complete
MDKTARLEVAILILEQRIEALEQSLIKIRQISQETLQDKNLRTDTGPGTEDPDERFEVTFNWKKNERDPQP